MSDSEPEYEVESVTRARVHDKRGKKLIWKYYVKWKGYDWDECTWEPVEHFTKEAKKIIDTFWDRVDTGGRDVHDATLFKKGDEVIISGPPGKKTLKRKQSAAMIQHSTPTQKTDVPTLDATISISPPRTTPRKRRKVQKPYDDILEAVQPKSQVRAPRIKRRIHTTTQKGVGRANRRRASSPGPRRMISRRLPSVTDSELDAEGEIDPDIEIDSREVEDALMQSSVEDGDERSRKQESVAKNGSGTRDIAAFDDLEHFHGGQPIEIEQTNSEDVEVTCMASAPEAEHSPTQKRGSPTPSSPDPLFDSPPRSKATTRERSEDSSVPFHRARAANPLVKIMEAPVPQTSGTAITAKARLMSMPTASTSGAVPVRATAKRGRGGKPGPARLSANLLTKNRSSLLTATKGRLSTVKGTFAPINATRDQPEEIEEVPSAWETGESGLAITSWSDGDAVGETDGNHVLRASADPKPSGMELLKLAGVENDGTLPDFDEDVPQEKSTEDPQGQPKVETKQDEPTQSNDITEDQDAHTSSGLFATTTTAAVSATQSDLATTVASPAATTAEDNLKRNLALATEQLFPSASPQKLSRSLFSEAPTSFTSTIFGPLYQGTPNHASSSEANEIGCSTSFKIIVNDTISIPLTLEDVTHMQGRMNDFRIGKSANGRAGNFYGENDALAIVNTLRSHGTARVVPDASADTEQKEHFAAFLNHFESNRTFVSAVGVDVYVLYSSESIAVAEKLSTPGHLIGLGSTLLVSRASIENQSTYAQAAYAAQSVLS